MKLKHRILCALIGSLYAVSAAAVPVSAADGKKPASGPKAFTDCLCDFPLVTLDQIPASKNALKGIRYANAAAPSSTTKTIPLLVVTVGFADQPYSSDFDVAKMFFEDEKSITQYYYDQSYGQFTYVPATESSAAGVGGNHNTADKANDGVVHVTLDSNHGDWSSITDYEDVSDAEHEAYNLEYSKTLYAALSDALDQADEYVDFSSFDQDGDGEIQTTELALCFRVAGMEASEVSEEDYSTVDRTKLFWSHAYNLEGLIYSAELDADVPNLDGTWVSNYIGVAEYCDAESVNDTSVVCHELGHYLGLPDLYDTTYDTTAEWSDYQVNYLSLMASGNGTLDPDSITGYLQASIDMWSKVQLGWVEPKEVTKSGTYTIRSLDYDDLSTEDQALYIATSNPNEYYIVENRQSVKWDRGLTYLLNLMDSNTIDKPSWNQEGLIFWHVDMSNYDELNDENTVNVPTHRPAVMPLFGEYVDEGDNGYYTIIGDYPDPYAGFFSKLVWETRYSETVGNVLDLPMYGTGSNADLRSGRQNSGIKVSFDTDSAAEMKITVDFGDLPAQPEKKPGDVDGNGIVNASDAAEILMEAAKLGAGEEGSLTAEQFVNADVNGDDQVDATDAAIILQYSAAVGAGQIDAVITDFI